METIKEQVEKLHALFINCKDPDCVVVIGCRDEQSFAAVAGKPIVISTKIAMAMAVNKQFAETVIAAVKAYGSCSPDANEDLPTDLSD